MTDYKTLIQIKTQQHLQFEEPKLNRAQRRALGKGNKRNAK